MRKRKFAIIMMLVLLIAFAPVSAFAETISPHFLTAAGTAGSYHNESTHSVTSSTLITLGGGDVGIYFYSTSVGLQSSFIRDNNRKVIVQMYEKDVFPTTARIREGYFATSGGVYRPTIWSYTYTTTATIENDATAELYISWNVNKVTGDMSSSIPAGLMEYAFWVF